MIIAKKDMTFAGMFAKLMEDERVQQLGRINQCLVLQLAYGSAAKKLAETPEREMTVNHFTAFENAIKLRLGLRVREAEIVETGTKAVLDNAELNVIRTANSAMGAYVAMLEKRLCESTDEAFESLLAVRERSRTTLQRAALTARHARLARDQEENDLVIAAKRFIDEVEIPAPSGRTRANGAANTAE